jgi:hypothetical protein
MVEMTSHVPAILNRGNFLRPATRLSPQRRNLACAPSEAAKIASASLSGSSATTIR